MALLAKLKVKAAEPLTLINCPANCGDLFEGAEAANNYKFKQPVAQLILFAANSAELAHYITKLEGCILPNTIFWICYPKKSGAIPSDLIRDAGWAAVLAAGYRCTTSVSVNNDWTGMRFTNAPKKKETICDLPMEERQSEGIDFVSRTVTLPTDAVAAVDAYSGMHQFFNALAFTVKKEYVMAITESKKEETRQRRIHKMVAELQQKMLAKGL